MPVVIGNQPQPAPPEPPRIDPTLAKPSFLEGSPLFFMTQEQFLSVIRWLLAIMGPFLVSHGYATDSTVTEISGAIIALVPLVWSMATKTRAGIIKTAADLPEVHKIVATPAIADGTLRADPKVVSR